MATEHITDMTVEELQLLIEKVVDSRLQNWLQQPVDDSRSVQDILNSIDHHIWTPPPGTPSPTELLLEELSQWRQAT